MDNLLNFYGNQVKKKAHYLLNEEYACKMDKIKIRHAYLVVLHVLKKERCQ